MIDTHFTHQKPFRSNRDEVSMAYKAGNYNNLSQSNISLKVQWYFWEISLAPWMVAIICGDLQPAVRAVTTLQNTSLGTVVSCRDR